MSYAGFFRPIPDPLRYFNVPAVDAGQEITMDSVRLVAKHLAEFIGAMCPAGPDRVVALQRTREALYYAESAIAHGGGE